MHEAVFSAEYDTDERARRVERSLRPEVGDIDGDRTTVALDREGGRLDVTVRAADLTALRAGLNTWLGLVGVAERAGAVASRGGSARGSDRDASGPEEGGRDA